MGAQTLPRAPSQPDCESASFSACAASKSPGIMESRGKSEACGVMGVCIALQPRSMGSQGQWEVKDKASV